MIIKPPSLVDKYSHVYSGDPALDVDADGYAEAHKRFLDSGDKVHLDPFVKAGQELTVWELKPINGRAKRTVRKYMGDCFDKDGVCTDTEILWVSCALAVTGVDGLYDDRGKAASLVWHRDKETRLKCVTDESMDVLEQLDDGALVNEIGYRALAQMFASQD